MSPCSSLVLKQLEHFDELKILGINLGQSATISISTFRLPPTQNSLQLVSSFTKILYFLVTRIINLNKSPILFLTAS